MATLLDKVLLFPVLGFILANTAFAALTGLFGGHGAPTYTEHVLNALVRNFLNYMSIEQIQWIAPAFIDAYKSWCTKNNVKPDIVDIPNTTTQGFWLGPKSTAKYTLVYYHGGGYMMPGTADHINLLVRMIRWSNNNLAIFCVAYTLSPEAAYPAQIGECVEGLRYVLSLQGHAPENTLLGGDSAGGALVFAVLGHISHPHPQANVVRKLDLEVELKGAVAIAPWTSSDSVKYPSMIKSAGRDIVTNANAKYWSEAYKGRGKNVPDDAYVYGVVASPEWWKDIKCQHTLIVAGEDEGLLDAVVDFAKKYEQGIGKEKVKLVIGERETHVAPLNAIPEDRLKELGDKKQEGAIRLWLKEMLI